MPMQQPTEAQIKKFWTTMLNAKVARRSGFFGECGEFVDMQNNPYGKPAPRYKKTLCYLIERRKMDIKSIQEYEQDVKNGLARFVPKNNDYWERVPPIDLNNIFKYAIPKLQNEGYQIHIQCFEHKGFRVKIANVIHPEYEEKYSADDDLSLALFLAIWEVVK